MEVFWASGIGSGVKWADRPAEWTGLCPRSLGVADDDGRQRQTTMTVDNNVK